MAILIFALCVISLLLVAIVIAFKLAYIAFLILTWFARTVFNLARLVAAAGFREPPARWPASNDNLTRRRPY